jgi:hypothetical protein
VHFRQHRARPCDDGCTRVARATGLKRARHAAIRFQPMAANTPRSAGTLGVVDDHRRLRVRCGSRRTSPATTSGASASRRANGCHIAEARFAQQLRILFGRCMGNRVAIASTTPGARCECESARSGAAAASCACRPAERCIQSCRCANVSGAMYGGMPDHDPLSLRPWSGTWS